MAGVPLVVRSVTPFSRTGDLDEESFRRYLQRFVDAGLGVYVASSGSGEGAALTRDELSRSYRTAVAACGRQVTVGSNQPEQHTARATIELAQLAVDAGVDIVQLYGPAAWHGYVATESEYTTYFDHVLAEVRHPVALNPLAKVSYAAPHVIADICRRHPQVTAVNLTGQQDDSYFFQLREALTRDVDIYVDITGSLNTLAAGAHGVHSVTANFIPKTHRRYLDLCAEDKAGSELGRVYSDIQRVGAFMRRWKTSSPRCHKMMMKVFRLPGWEGGVREPYLAIDDAEVESFQAGVLALGIAEVNEMAQAAGIITPAHLG